ncbi:hypothetical protein [Marinospirillum sp.]|uniref:hypothetical protein n=1 Tax=Marinospirillum sp. TaxID=2183934 RepID=UPI00384FC823
MPFKRKLLLIVFLALMVVLLWPKGQEDLTPSTENRHQEIEEDTTRQEEPQPEEESQEERTPEEEGSDSVENLADLPLSDEAETESEGNEAEKEETEPTPQESGLSQAGREYLEQRGLDNPEEEVVRDLISRSDLLPQNSLEGGSVEFVEQETRLLNHRWVLATFTDGQTQGQALYEFEVSAGGDLVWVLLAQATSQQRSD